MNFLGRGDESHRLTSAAHPPLSVSLQSPESGFRELQSWLAELPNLVVSLDLVLGVRREQTVFLASSRLASTDGERHVVGGSDLRISWFDDGDEGIIRGPIGLFFLKRRRRRRRRRR